ncbi:HAD family hydrolase [Zavarzinia sp. CC-PAN008]|uniref:HAD family hydrolase n=1 Tax=Zavarzinia sp. CC-PAN008 TaxID=3243332 RepID=UPI003F747DC2
MPPDLTRRFDLVIFDCDGVLVDSEPIANAQLAAALAPLGLTMTVAEVMRDFVGLSMASVIMGVEQRIGRPVPPDWLPTLQARTYQAFRDGLKPVAGVAEAIRSIQAAGLATCVASSGSPDKMDLTLALTGLRPLFAERIFSATQVARGKPHPDLFLHAAARMDVAPDRACVVEDSLPGVQGAVAAGMAAFGYVPDGGHFGPERLSRAGARTFPAMACLPGLLGIAP